MRTFNILSERLFFHSPLPDSGHVPQKVFLKSSLTYNNNMNMNQHEHHYHLDDDQNHQDQHDDDKDLEHQDHPNDDQDRHTILNKLRF